MNAHVVASYLIGLATVGIALGVFYASVRAWKTGRFGKSSQKRLISVVETAVLTQNVVLQVVRIGTRYYALASGAGNATLLGELARSEIEPVKAT
ncbi:MAG: flagellar biosynthetic protein FliO [Candidatus Eremiobacteraeota bacterium]|nr:flagellar biosynthetic protein FliO [Candidatus Eremiobacteraeota bacterium]